MVGGSQVLEYPRVWCQSPSGSSACVGHPNQLRLAPVLTCGSVNLVTSGDVKVKQTLPSTCCLSGLEIQIPSTPLSLHPKLPGQCRLGDEGRKATPSTLESGLLAGGWSGSREGQCWGEASSHPVPPWAAPPDRTRVA